ncbi:AAA domain protein [Candidatus Bilamarchaeum dharawalense]|uniref:AAA domain protein n=1 Tax=Candidatus Bilamarchaeum dharawalense TaxID=2885759 RepID=A0A5E4LUD2_9ARCH|nr:AAA domain protein [Candidatus Bilamarchaeum dharawalense]
MPERVFFCRKIGCKNRAVGDKGRYGQCEFDGETFITPGEKLVYETEAAKEAYRQNVERVTAEYSCLPCEIYKNQPDNCPAHGPLKHKTEILNQFELDYEDRMLNVEQILGIAPKDNIVSETGQLSIIWEKELQTIISKPNNWIVDGYIPKDSIILLAGKRGFYKSWGALHLALAIASGKPFLGKYPALLYPVLYLDEENGVNVLKERVMQIKQGMGLEGSVENLCFSSFAGFKISNAQAKLALETFIKQHGIKVIIVDTLRRIISSEENDAGEINSIFTNLIRPISSEYGVTWIFLHHLRKGMAGKVPTDLLDELRGSSELANYADGVIIFEKPPKTEARFNIVHGKCRNAQAQEARIVELKFEEKSVKFEVLGTAQAIVDAADECASTILRHLEVNSIEDFKTHEILEVMKAQQHSKATITRALAILDEQGKIVREKKGHYRRIIGRLEEYVEDKSEESNRS